MPVSRYLVYLAIAVGGCGLDLLTKYFVFHWRGMPPVPPNALVLWPMPLDHREWWLWDGYVGIETSVNQGALFGLGQGQGFFFSILSIIAAVGILLWLFRFGAARDWLLTIALACVTGGILGNLYDRLGLWEAPGAPGVFPKMVRDWILFRYHGHTWPNFNIADSLLVSGACLLMYHGFIDRPPAQQLAKKSRTKTASVG